METPDLDVQESLLQIFSKYTEMKVIYVKSITWCLCSAFKVTYLTDYAAIKYPTVKEIH